MLLLVLAAAPPLARAQEEAAAMAKPTPFAVAAEAAAGEKEPLPQSGADEGTTTMGLDQLDVAFTYAKTDKGAIAGFQAAVTQLLAPFGKWGCGRSLM